MVEKQFVHPWQRVLVALDTPTLSEALALVEQLHGRVGGFKVGLELCCAEGVPHVVEAISAAGGSVFLDLKLKDIPNTVSNTVRTLSDMPGVRMLTLHSDGGSSMLRAAVSALHHGARDPHSKAPLLLGVTVLTSMDATRLAQVGIRDTLETQVVRLAKLAQMAGLSGVIASPHEVAAIKKACGVQFLTVTPGIRPAWALTGDQQRVMTPAEALRAGTDYMVIGRPITAAPTSQGGAAGALARITAELEESG
jgi:orotidine-5'-phosphate decarboxylase